MPRPSERITREKEFIEATSRLCSFNLMSRPGIPISPIEIRLTKDRLSLVARVLSNNADAYKHTQVSGDITGAGNHDEQAKKIALAGAKWARTFWRDEDATAYMYRLVWSHRPSHYGLMSDLS